MRLVVGQAEPSPQIGLLWQVGEGILEGDSRFRQIFNALPVAIYTTDAAGRITFYNEAAAAFWGHRPTLGDDQWCGSWKLFWPDGTPLPHDECPMAVALKEGRAVRNIEAVAERPDGSRVPFMPFPTPLYDASGTLIGAVNLLMDLTERKRAERSGTWLAAIVASSDDAIISKDLDGTISSWNHGAERLFGYTAGEAVGRSITMLIPYDRHNEEPEIVERIRRGERIDHYETVRRRKDGSLIEISLTVSPVMNAEGKVVGASKIARDITERKRAQEQQNLILGEIKHRIKNTLAIVQAIAMQTMSSASSEERGAFVGRLHALANTHDLLRLEIWNRASLRDVVSRVLEPFREKHRDPFVIDGPDNVWLNANKSVLLAMVLHELATNAVKYGALSNKTGQVHVGWELPQGGHPDYVKFCWRESGGPRVGAPDHKGFGTLLIERALGAEFGAVCIEYVPGGVICKLEIPI